MKLYQLDPSKEFGDYAKKLSEKLGLPLKRLSCALNRAIQPGNFVYMPSPAKFLQLFKGAYYILTDSFHARVFSLIFNKRFLMFAPRANITRLQSMLESCGQEDRMVEKFNEFSWLENDIDYKLVTRLNLLFCKLAHILNSKRI